MENSLAFLKPEKELTTDQIARKKTDKITTLPVRPNYNNQGKQINIRVNQYKVLQAPDNDIYQYDVSIPTFSKLTFGY